MEKSELIKQNGGKTRKADHSTVFLYLNNAIHKLYYFLKVDFRLPYIKSYTVQELQKITTVSLQFINTNSSVTCKRYSLPAELMDPLGPYF